MSKTYAVYFSFSSDDCSQIGIGGTKAGHANEYTPKRLLLYPPCGGEPLVLYSRYGRWNWEVEGSVPKTFTALVQQFNDETDTWEDVDGRSAQSPEGDSDE